MTEEAILEEGAELLEHPFIKQMIVQLRAVDSYGTYDTWSDAKVLDPMILTKAKRREIPVIGDPDEIVISRVKAYYNCLALMIEKNTGLMAVPVINLTHEGFGRAFISVGKLIVLDRTLRDVHRFGFPTVEALVAEAEKYVGKATELVETYREVAKL